MPNILPSRPRVVGQRRSFAIVAGQYHAEFVGALVEHTRAELLAISNVFSVSVYEVPGAFEIPLAVSEVAMRGGVDAIIALGVIIEGQTAHASLIAQTITGSLQQLSLSTRLPIIHEVLLVKNEAQARERCIGEEINRGTEAARAAARMVQVIGEIRGNR